MNLSDIQKSLTPEQWSVIDESMNDIRREAAAALQMQGIDHAAALAEKDATITALTEFKTRTEAGIVQVIATIQNPEIDSETTANTILAIIAQGTAPAAERADAEVDKQLAELLAKRSKPLTADDLAELLVSNQ